MPDQIDPYKILQVDSEAEDEVIQAAYRRLARKYHPDLAGQPRRGEPDGRDQCGLGVDRRAGEARGVRPRARPARDDASAAGGWPDARSGRRAAPQAAAHRPGPVGSSSSSGGTSSASTPPPETVSRDWTSGRSTQGSGYRGVDARRGWVRCRRAAAGPAVGHGPELRSLCRVVAGRGRPDATWSTSSGSTARRSAGTTARRSTRSCARVAGASRPTRARRTAEGCSAAVVR